MRKSDYTLKRTTQSRYHALYRTAVFGILVVLLSLEAPAQQRNEEAEYRLLSAAGSISLGDSESVVTRKVEPVWLPVRTNKFLEIYPFKPLLPYTNSALVSEWRSSETMPGTRQVLFVVFGNAAKSNVVD